jgi:hypothetical protein
MVFGVASHRAVQVLLDDDHLPLRAPLYRSEAEARASEGPAARAT